MKQKKNIFSVVLTVLILTLFLITGPANALDASIDIGDHTPDEKDNFTFQIHVKI